MNFTLSKWECDRCSNEFEAYDYELLCPQCEELIDSLNCSGCEFLGDYGFDYTTCELRNCNKVQLSYSDIRFCKRYKIIRR